MKSAGAIFPNRSPSNLPFVGRDHPPIPSESARKKKTRKRGRNEERENRDDTNQTEGDPRSLHFSCDRVCASPFFFSRRILVSDGAFCRFVEHVRDVDYQNATSNDRHIELVGALGVLRAEGRARRERGNGGGGGGDRDESTSENYESS